MGSGLTATTQTPAPLAGPAPVGSRMPARGDSGPAAANWPLWSWEGARLAPPGLGAAYESPSSWDAGLPPSRPVELNFWPLPQTWPCAADASALSPPPPSGGRRFARGAGDVDSNVRGCGDDGLLSCAGGQSRRSHQPSLPPPLAAAVAAAATAAADARRAGDTARALAEFAERSGAVRGQLGRHWPPGDPDAAAAVLCCYANMWSVE